jgi:hypothetical protein
MSFLEMEQMFCETLRRMKKGNKLTTEACSMAIDGETVSEWADEGELEVGETMLFPSPTPKPEYYTMKKYDKLLIVPMEVEPVVGGGAGAGGGSSSSKWHDKLLYVKKDQYGTPASAWQNVAHLIPAGSRIWEPFWMDSASGQYLRALGFTVHHENEDFFELDKAGALRRGDIVLVHSYCSCTHTARALMLLVH